ncbi:translation termination factor GTPase eRF3 [Batrachochytrium dendrobatidis]|nr:translation termination factor GTPase eRF3 [Batrachochytrium dendrobatidis]
MSDCNNTSPTDKTLAESTNAALSITDTAASSKKPAACGGGGGPAFNFKSSFNFGASEFVPTWSVPSTPAPAKAVSLSLGSSKPVSEAAKPVLETAKPLPVAAPAPKEENVAKKAVVPTPVPAPVAPVIDEPEEEDIRLGEGVKKHLNIIFLGHVDAGKSTMGGHILFLTGMVDKRTMEKYEREAKELGRESWYLSWALDLNQEERSKGKTTEYGRGYFETEQRRFTIIDAPGHKTFVPSMLGGAAQADVGVLVISARKGEFETGFEKGGQTREHTLLAKTAGVKRLIVVINKMDDPTVQFSKERYDECVGKIMPYIKGVGYQKADIDIMPVSGFTGANLKEPLDSAVCDWYTGPTLLYLLDNMIIDRKYSGPLMMPIADKMKDMGTVVLGKIESGSVKKGQTIMLMPNRRTAEVTAIMQEDSEITVAMTGDNVRVRLRGVEEDDVMSGFVMCQIKKPVHSVCAFEAQIAIIEYKSIMCAGYSAVMHIHTAVEEVSITSLIHMIDKKTGRKSKHPPKFVKKGDSVIVRIDVSQSVCAEPYAEYPQLGRFTLRDEGITVAVGKIIRLINDAVPQ